MTHLSFRPLSLDDASSLLLLMRRAKGGLGRLPEEMDLPWMEEALTGALAGGVAIGARDGPWLVGIISMRLTFTCAGRQTTQATASATSSGVPSRRTGCCSTSASR